MNDTVPVWAWWLMFGMGVVALLLCRAWEFTCGKYREALKRERERNAELVDDIDERFTELVESEPGEHFAFTYAGRTVLVQVVSVMEVEAESKRDGDD